MSSQTRIVILKMRTVVYTGIFLFLILVLGILLFLMFGKKTEGAGDSASSASPASSVINQSAGLSETSIPQYSPGCYNSVMKLGDCAVNVSVTVSADRIESIRLQDVSEEIASAYPLLEPAMEALNEQIITTQSTEYLTYDDAMQYTQTALTDTINLALKKAAGKP